MAESELAALVARLEKEDGPAFVLDVAIAEALGRVVNPPKPYTYSLDAAMSLVPEGRDHFRLYRLLDQWHAEIGLWYWPAASDEPGQLQEWHEGQSHTPALALCIASLRARLTSTPTTGA